MKDVNINNTPYNIPELQDKNWGEYTTDLLEGLTRAVTGIYGPNDIAETSSTINNAVTSPTDIPSLLFDISTTRGAIVEFSIFRTSATTTKKETGTIWLTYDAGAASGEKWTQSQVSNSDAGVDISVTDAGQMQYTSDNIGTSGYVGTITFRGKGILSS